MHVCLWGFSHTSLPTDGKAGGNASSSSCLEKCFWRRIADCFTKQSSQKTGLVEEVWNKNAILGQDKSYFQVSENSGILKELLITACRTDLLCFGLGKLRNKSWESMQSILLPCSPCCSNWVWPCLHQCPWSFGVLGDSRDRWAWMTCTFSKERQSRGPWLFLFRSPSSLTANYEMQGLTEKSAQGTGTFLVWLGQFSVLRMLRNGQWKSSCPWGAPLPWPRCWVDGGQRGRPQQRIAQGSSNRVVGAGGDHACSLALGGLQVPSHSPAMSWLCPLHSPVLAGVLWAPELSTA